MKADLECLGVMLTCSYGIAVRYVVGPSEAVKLAAVRQNGYAIQLIVSPSEEVQLAAVRQNGCACGYIRNPSEIVLKAARENGYAS